MTNSVDVWSDDEGVRSPVSYRLAAALERSVYDELETNSPPFSFTPPSFSPIEQFWSEANGGGGRRRQLPSLDRVKASSSSSSSSHRGLVGTNSQPTLVESSSSSSTSGGGGRVLRDTPPRTRPVCLSLTSSSQEAAFRRGHMRSDANNYRPLPRELQSTGPDSYPAMIDRTTGGQFLLPRDNQRLAAVSDDALVPRQPEAHRLIGPTRSADPSGYRFVIFNTNHFFAPNSHSLASYIP